MSQVPFIFEQKLSPLQDIQQSIDMFGRGITRPTEQEGIDFNRKIKERISGLSESDRNSFYDKNPGYNPEFRLSDPRGTGGALEGSPRGPQQQNPYDSLKKLFGENVQRYDGNLQNLFGRIGQQTGQIMAQTTVMPNRPMRNQGPQYEGRNSDGSIFRSQLPMGNNRPVLTNHRAPPRQQMGQQRGQLPQQQMGQQRGQLPQPPQPNQGYGNRFPGMQFSGPFSQPMMPQNYGMGGGYRMGGGYQQPPMMPQYPQPRMPYPQPMPQPGYGGGYGGGFGGRGPGGGYGNMYAQQPQMYGGGYPPQPPMFGGFGGGMQGGYGQQPQFGGGFGGATTQGPESVPGSRYYIPGYGSGYGGGMGGMYNQPQRQPQYQNAGPSPFGGQMNQRQQPQQMAQQMGGGFQQMGGFGGGIMRSFY